MGTGTGSPLTKRPLEVKLAKPRGFCAGVERAIEIVERALALYGAPVYVRHEIVHNKRVVQSLHDKGAIFVEEVDEIPPGAVTVFSAHGVSRVVEGNARDRTLQVIDATCPLVSKVHKEGRRSAEMGHDVVLIGHKGHPEVIGTFGQVSDGEMTLVETVEDVATLEFPAGTQLSYLTQTTLSVDDTAEIIRALTERFPEIVAPKAEDICYATSNRQAAVKEIAPSADLTLVIGAPNSSNSLRLVEVSDRSGTPAKLIQRGNEIEESWLDGVETIGLTAGASAPETLVREVIAKLGEFRTVCERTLVTAEEKMVFKLPRQLTD